MLVMPIMFSALTLPMLRLLSSKAQGCKDLRKPSKPCLVGTHWKALAECSHMSTHLPGFRSFSGFLHHFVLAKLAISSRKLESHTYEVLFSSIFPSWLCEWCGDIVNLISSSPVLALWWDFWIYFILSNLWRKTTCGMAHSWPLCGCH